jgi:hypothetical protein
MGHSHDPSHGLAKPKISTLPSIAISDDARTSVERRKRFGEGPHGDVVSGRHQPEILTETQVISRRSLFAALAGALCPWKAEAKPRINDGYVKALFDLKPWNGRSSLEWRARRFYGDPLECIDQMRAAHPKGWIGARVKWGTNEKGAFLDVVYVSSEWWEAENNYFEIERKLTALMERHQKWWALKIDLKRSLATIADYLKDQSAPAPRAPGSASPRSRG